jgi:hypothetical protein
MKDKNYNQPNTAQVISDTTQGINLLAVTTNGSPVSTQIWADNKENNVTKAAAMKAMEWFSEGQDPKDGWREPIAFVFITLINSKKTFVFDFSRPADMLMLRLMTERPERPSRI